MKASYTAAEIAEFYTKSGLKDNTDIKSLVNESIKLFAQKNGIEKAKEVATLFNNASIFTCEGLTAYLNAICIEYVNFADPVDGKIGHTAYIHLK